MPGALKVWWWIALALIGIGLAPVAIAMIGGAALGPVGYLGIVTFPLALIGACLVPVLLIWTLVVRLRR